MGRVRTNIVVAGKNYWTLFDSGSRNTYVTEDVARNLLTSDLPRPYHVSLGGKVHNVVKRCELDCEIEGLPVEVHSYVLDEIGLDEKGKKIEVLFGALAMQQWGIEINLKEEKLDMSHYSKEFVEF
jgi:hypothetical protein